MNLPFSDFSHFFFSSRVDLGFFFLIINYYYFKFLKNFGSQVGNWEVFYGFLFANLMLSLNFDLVYITLEFKNQKLKMI